jgi:hypothetical protein
MPLPDVYGVPILKSLAAVVTLFFAGASIVCAQDKRIGTFQFESKASHTAKVIFQTRAFDRSKHKVEYGNFHNRVDGRVAYGAESVPSVEISSVKFFFDGRAIKVPRSLYSDCYNPNFDSQKFVKMRFSRDLQSVIISMSGADGAGGYEVTWRLRKNGKHSRSFSEGL